MTVHPFKKGLVIALLMTALVVSALDKGVFAFAGPALIRDLSLTPRQFGFAGSAFFFFYSFSGIAVGFLSNRVATRWILVGMSIVWALSQFMVTTASTFGLLVASRLLLGIGAGPATPIAQHACFKWFDASARAVASALMQCSLMVGAILSGALLPTLLLRYGWRAVFAALGVASVIWIAAWLRFGREGENEPVIGGARRALLPYRDLLFNRSFLFVCILGVIGYVPIVFGFSWLAVYLQKGLGVAPKASGFFLTAITTLSIVVNLVASFASQRATRRGASLNDAVARPVLLAVLAGGGCFVALSTAGEASVVGRLLIFAAGATLLGLVPTFGMILAAGIATPAQRGAMLAIYNGVATLAGVVAPYSVGVLVTIRNGNIAAGAEVFLGLFGAGAVVAALIGFFALTPDTTRSEILRKLAGMEPLRA